MLRNIAVPVLAPVPAFELGVVCDAFGLDHALPGLPAYDFAVCGDQITPVPTTSGFAVLPAHDLSGLADAGFDHLVAMNAGPDPDGFMDFFTRELTGPLRALTPGRPAKRPSRPPPSAPAAA